MKVGFVVLSLGVSINALASTLDGRWYFTETRCLSASGEVRRLPLSQGEAMWFDFAGERGSGVAMIRNAQGLCTIDFNMRVSGASSPGSRVIIERQVKGASPTGCSDSMTADRSAYEFSLKTEQTALELKENRPTSRECRTRISYLTRDPAGSR